MTGSVKSRAGPVHGRVGICLGRLGQAGTAALREGVDVRTIVADAVEAIGPEAAERKVGIRREPAPRRIELLADRRMAMQAVLSILSNAVRASPPGETVVAAIQFGAEGVQAAIADHGSSISIAVREHLVEPFGRHRADIADRRQGLGLGLLVARSFMEIHGGTIGIQAAADQGTVVTLTFPPERVATADA